MKPLVLREIADELGLHESTISRVTTAKYMATPFGTFELKYFFGSSLGTDAGGNASSTAVRALIRQIVAAEDPAKPLSDSQISQMLDEQGIQVARRTVAKYREALKIAPAQAAQGDVGRTRPPRPPRAKSSPCPCRFSSCPAPPASRPARRGSARACWPDAGVRGRARRRRARRRAATR